MIPPNEDEYSAALERLLESCPACTCCSSQIGSKVGVEGGVQLTELKWGSWVGGGGAAEMTGVADRQGRHGGCVLLRQMSRKQCISSVCTHTQMWTPAQEGGG